MDLDAVLATKYGAGELSYNLQYDYYDFIIWVMAVLLYLRR